MAVDVRTQDSKIFKNMFWRSSSYSTTQSEAARSQRTSHVVGEKWKLWPAWLKKTTPQESVPFLNPSFAQSLELGQSEASRTCLNKGPSCLSGKALDFATGMLKFLRKRGWCSTQHHPTLCKSPFPTENTVAAFAFAFARRNVGASVNSMPSPGMLWALNSIAQVPAVEELLVGASWNMLSCSFPITSHKCHLWTSSPPQTTAVVHVPWVSQLVRILAFLPPPT